MATDPTRSPSAEMTEVRSADRTAPPILRYVDVVLVLLGAPLLLLAGAPAAGYLTGASAWILLRVLGLAVDRHASTVATLAQQMSIRMGFRLVRVTVLVAAALLALKVTGRSGGVTSLLVITLAFTVQLIALVFERLGR